MTDAEKLRTLADWFDLQDSKVWKDSGEEVQKDLRRIADRLEQQDKLMEMALEIFNKPKEIE
jgi:hypothetical protein